MTKVSLDIDDGSVIYMNWDKIERLKERYPAMKLSVFFVPFDYENEKQLVRIVRDQSLKKLREYADWIQLIPHGLAHLPNEFMNCDKDTMEMVLKAIGEAMGRDKLPYEKGFKAPQWLYNQDVVDVLDKNDWWIAVDRNDPRALKTKRFFRYSQSIDEPFWKSTDETWKLHGHMGLPMKNNIDDCFLNLLKIPLDSQWHFVTDFLEGEEGNK